MRDSKQVVVFGGFDDIRSSDLRFLQEAAKLGAPTVLIWPDNLIQQASGAPPKFPLLERAYFLNAVRYVNRVIPLRGIAGPDALPEIPGRRAEIWADLECRANPAREKFCREHKISYRVFKADEMKGFPEPLPTPSKPGKRKVIVSGSYDWLHSGHVRFLEEVSEYGDLYVVVGHDANVRLLKGEGHPLFPAAERRYMVGSIKYVTRVLISSGDGWLDADPEIRQLKPDIYAVNEDGDQGGKREYCQKLGIEYLVLKRIPAAGLPQRTSTELRGF
ncbi:MAG: adenylyltransferase/cytidyltransferase family protein [Candidatus Acidiferrum sp.]